jgi:hypothetical protein
VRRYRVVGSEIDEAAHDRCFLALDREPARIHRAQSAIQLAAYDEPAIQL